MKRKLVLIMSVAVVAVALAAPIPIERNGWSKPISGIQARFGFEVGRLFNGTRLTKVYLELRNVSDVANPIYLRYDPTRSIKAQLFDSGGKPVPITGNPASIMSPPPFLLCLPYDSTLRFNVTAIGYGVPKDEKALIGLHSGDWVIKKGDASKYFLGGTFISEKPKKETQKRLWVGKIDIPQIEVHVLNGKAPNMSMNRDKP
jgi:hypothetical protein